MLVRGRDSGGCSGVTAVAGRPEGRKREGEGEEGERSEDVDQLSCEREVVVGDIQALYDARAVAGGERFSRCGHCSCSRVWSRWMLAMVVAWMLDGARRGNEG